MAWRTEEKTKTIHLFKSRTHFLLNAFSFDLWFLQDWHRLAVLLPNDIMKGSDWWWEWLSIVGLMHNSNLQSECCIKYCRPWQAIQCKGTILMIFYCRIMCVYIYLSIYIFIFTACIQCIYTTSMQIDLQYVHCKEIYRWTFIHRNIYTRCLKSPVSTNDVLLVWFSKVWHLMLMVTSFHWTDIPEFQSNPPKQPTIGWRGELNRSRKQQELTFRWHFLFFFPVRNDCICFASGKWWTIIWIIRLVLKGNNDTPSKFNSWAVNFAGCFYPWVLMCLFNSPWWVPFGCN